MKLTWRRLTVRKLLATMTVAACVAATVAWAHRIHKAATFIESIGGDVWCFGRLYTGSDLGRPPMSACQRLWLRTSIVSQIMLGKRTDLWVCFVPDDRERFAESLTRLNPQEIMFEVLGPKDLDWIEGRCPGVTIGAVNGLEREVPKADTAGGAPARREPTSRTAVDIAGMVAEFDEMRAENPRLFYRLDRYETIIGYPPPGKMGMLYDKHTGRTIYLPWPR